MDTEVITLLIPVIVALLASIPGILGFLGSRKRDRAEGVAKLQEANKAGADTTQVLVGTATALVQSMNERVRDLESREEIREQELCTLKKTVEAFKVRLDNMERINRILCDGVRMLIEQAESLGAEPVFVIDDELCKSINNDKN